MSDYQFNPNVEQWKEIPGFPGYEVSDHGRVRSFLRLVSLGKGKGTKSEITNSPQTIRKPSIHRTGYYHLPFQVNGMTRYGQVHQLVMLAFVGPVPPKMEVCHRDNNRLNNCIDNLRYGSRSSNHMDKYGHGTMPHGDKCSWAVLKEDDVINIRQLYSAGVKQVDIAIQYKVCKQSVYNIVHHRSWKHLP